MRKRSQHYEASLRGKVWRVITSAFITSCMVDCILYCSGTGRPIHLHWLLYSGRLHGSRKVSAWNVRVIWLAIYLFWELLLLLYFLFRYTLLATMKFIKYHRFGNYAQFGTTSTSFFSGVVVLWSLFFLVLPRKPQFLQMLSNGSYHCLVAADQFLFFPNNSMILGMYCTDCWSIVYRQLKGELSIGQWFKVILSILSDLKINFYNLRPTVHFRGAEPS